MRERYRIPGNQPASSPVRRLSPMPPVHAPAKKPPQPTPPEPRREQAPASRHQAAQAARRPAPESKRRRRRSFKVFMVIIILTLLGCGGYFGYTKYRQKNPFPVDIVQQSKLSLFYPSKLPAGFAVDQSSMQVTNGITAFSAINGSQKLVFTQQKTPASFNFGAFYSQSLTDTNHFTTSYGQAAVGKNSGRWLGSLVSGDTWLLLSTNSAQPTSGDMRFVLNNVKKY